MRDNNSGFLFLIALVALLYFGTQQQGCDLVLQKADRATYVFEQRAGEVPPAVRSAISKLNDRGILATEFDKDTLNKLGGKTPEQYKVAIEAAKVLPSLVVQNGQRVLSVIEKPTGDQVEAVK